MSGVPTPPGYVWDEKTKKWVKKDKDSLLSRTTEVLKDGAKAWVDPRRIKPAADKINKTAPVVLSNAKDNLELTWDAFKEADDLGTKARIAQGVGTGVLSGDIFDKPDPNATGFDPDGPAILYINGMNTPNKEADADQEALAKKCGYNVARVQNNTGCTKLIQDALQSFGLEQGNIDITVLRTAYMIRQGLIGKDEIHIVAHSQGTKVFEQAIALLTPEERSKIKFQGFGGEQYVDGDKHGLASARNVRHVHDPIPAVNEVRTGPASTVLKENWETLRHRPKVDAGKEPQLLDHHDFRKTYVDSVELPVNPNRAIKEEN